MVGTETILVTGGAGFIGSHTCVELLAQGYRVVALDSLINSHPEAIARIRRIAGGELASCAATSVPLKRWSSCSTRIA